MNTDSDISRSRVGVGIVLILMMFSMLAACGEQKEHTAPAVRERDSVSMMTTYGVNTLISDSGMMKYRIVTERWDVNITKNPSRWTFERGIFLEQYDDNFHVEAYIQADTAWYFDQQKLWKLRGRVRILNVNGLRFNSEELYWDGQKHELYSNMFSRVVTPERTLEGTYFRSDERMAHYYVSNSVGSFQQTDMEKETTQPENNATDTARQEPPQRPAAVKRASKPQPPRQ